MRRVSSRNHPEIDRGWICDKGRFTYPALRAPDRVTAPGIRVPGTWRFAEASWDEALDELERLARAAGDSVVLALSGSETVEIASALSQLVRKGFGSHRVVLPEETSTALDPFRAPLSAIADAEIVVVVGDDPVAERAPIVDLWIRAARRNGAEVLTFGPAGSVQRPPGDGAAVVAELADKRKALGKRLHAAERVALIWSGPGGRGGAALAPLAEALGLADKPGSGAYFLPATPNGRGVAAAWAGARARASRTAPERVGLLLISGEEAVADPRVRALAERSDAVAAVTMFSESVRGWTHVVLPGTSYLERDGTMVNLEGREQRLRKATEPPGRADLDWIAELAARFGVTIELPDELTRRRRHGRRADAAVEPLKPPVAPKLRLTRYRALFSGSAVERVPQLQFQRPEAVIELSPEDAKKRSIERGRDGDGARERHVRRAPRADQPPARGRRGARRRGARPRPARPRRGAAVRFQWVVYLIEAFIVINILLLAFAYTTLLERKLLGRMQRRYGPNRAGWVGLLQPIADLLKLVRKEAFFPRKVEAIPYIVAPAFSAFTALLAFSVIPFGEGWEIRGYQINGAVATIDIGLIVIFALGSIGVYGFIVGGWASESKFSLLGSMRTCAQLVSYEVSLSLSVIGVILIAESLNLSDDRREADRHDVVRRPAARRLRGLLHRRDGGDGPGAVRPRRGRLGDRRRLPHGVQRHALGALPDGRVHQPHRPLRARP